MNQIVPISPSAVVSLSLLQEDSDDLLLSEKAASTRASYAADFAKFGAWCAAHGLCPLPAAPATLKLWITWLCRHRKLRPNTLARRVAAVRHVHLAANYPNPGDAPEVRRAVRAARRELGTSTTPRAALTAPMISQLLSTCDDSLTGLRDKALLALGFAGALRRSELVALEVSDLTPTERGMDLRVKRSKSDQEAAGVVLAVPFGDTLLPVQRIRDWLTASGIVDGALFRWVKKGGHIQPEPLRPHSVGIIAKRRARMAGIDPTLVGSHSLRSGYVTSCCEHGVAPLLIAEQTRHKSLDMLLVYSRRADRYRNHSGKAFL